MFEYAGGEWPKVSKPEPVIRTSDDPRVDLWVAQEITSNSEEARKLLFLRWRIAQGVFNGDH
jgi:hypothetical protein